MAFSANDIIITGKDGVLRGSVGVRTPTDHIKEAKTTSNAVGDRLEYTESRIPSSSRGSMLDSAEAAYISVLEDNLLLIFPSRKSPPQSDRVRLVPVFKFSLISWGISL